MRQGFTILELMVVITVIVALCGIVYPIFTSIQQRSAINSTKILVHGVVAAADEYSEQFVTGTDGHLWHAWMLGQVALDGVTPVTTQMDGQPSLYLTTDPSPLATRAPPTYTGFLNMTGFAPPWSPNSKGQVLDRWQQPLNIAYATAVYGKDGIGVWSNGPDKLSGSADDINSWTGNGDQ